MKKRHSRISFNDKLIFEKLLFLRKFTLSSLFVLLNLYTVLKCQQ